MQESTSLQMVVGIRKLSRFLDKYSKYLNAKYQITLPQMLSLYEISRVESLNFTALTKLINLNNSAVTGIVDRLEAKGFVNRIRVGTDRRAVHIQITDTGRAFVEKFGKVLDEDSFFDTNALSEDDIRDLLHSIAKLNNALDPEIKKIELL